MAQIDDSALVDTENKIRDLINWVAVFNEEYDLPNEVVEQLKSKLEEIAVALKG